MTLDTLTAEYWCKNKPALKSRQDKTLRFYRSKSAQGILHGLDNKLKMRKKL